MRPCRHGLEGLPHDPSCIVCRKDQNDPELHSIWDRFDFNRTTKEMRLDLAYRRPCHRRHPSIESHPECPTCLRWDADTSFRDRWAEYVKHMTEKGEDPIDSVPCRHRGPLVPLTERYKYNLGTLKDWYPCGLGFGENGFMCPCGGCNPMCVGYEFPVTELTIED